MPNSPSAPLVPVLFTSLASPANAKIIASARRTTQSAAVIAPLPCRADHNNGIGRTGVKPPNLHIFCTRARSRTICLWGPQFQQGYPPWCLVGGAAPAGRTLGRRRRPWPGGFGNIDAITRDRLHPFQGCEAGLLVLLRQSWGTLRGASSHIRWCPASQAVVNFAPRPSVNCTVWCQGHWGFWPGPICVFQPIFQCRRAERVLSADQRVASV